MNGGLASLGAAIAAGLLMGSCAATVPKVSEADDAHLDANQGVIFGRIAVQKNGQPFTTDVYKNLVKPQVGAHLSPFEGVEKLQRNDWLPGKWFFRAYMTEGGYFSTTLPAGKYYFVEFMFFDITRDMMALRTYYSNSLASIARPMVVTFEVLPGKTTYIGTLAHKIDTDGARYAASAVWALDLIDESSDATRWFRTQHPHTAAIETQLAQKTDLK